MLYASVEIKCNTCRLSFGLQTFLGFMGSSDEIIKMLCSKMVICKDCCSVGTKSQIGLDSYGKRVLLILAVSK